MEDKRIERIKELVPILNEAAREYYSNGREIMPNIRYDELYDELEKLEKETGVVLSSSPTVRVGYEAASSLPREKHSSPMLSLGKTKNREELAAWLGDREGLLSWKLDGLTIVLTYEDGELKKAVTRGDGKIGEVITANAMCFTNLPGRISYRGRLVVRGEAVISYEDFERINREIADEDSKYKNPRNLCSGSVRQLDPEVTRRRSVRLMAFALVEASDENGGPDFENSMEKRFLFLKSQGFEVVEYVRVTGSTLISAIEDFEHRVESNPLPSDGLVLLMDDIAYGASLGSTAKAPRNAMAFKWADETALTHLRYIEWSPSRTGLINPVAVFDPVDLEGTSVSRASVHNVSIVEELSLGEGDEIEVYKANMIIPQISRNLTMSGNIKIPDECPACGGKTVIRSDHDTRALYCENPSCPAKQVKAFALYCSREAMNVEGLSEQTLEKLISLGLIHEYSDIYRLEEHRSRIESMEGFGALSCKNLLDSIERSRHSTLPRFLTALGIPGIGENMAGVLSRHFRGDFGALKGAMTDELSAIDGVGPVVASAIRKYFDDDEKRGIAERAYEYLEIEDMPLPADNTLDGKIFVITGSLNSFANRGELKAFIEDRGGHVTGSVTSRTDFLINNDVNSASTKNKKARELGVKIISEEEFLDSFR